MTHEMVPMRVLFVSFTDRVIYLFMYSKFWIKQRADDTWDGPNAPTVRLIAETADHGNVSCVCVYGVASACCVCFACVRWFSRRSLCGWRDIHKLCCSVLQCVAAYCSVLQCVAVCCSVLQCGWCDIYEWDAPMHTFIRAKWLIHLGDMTHLFLHVTYTNESCHKYRCICK